MAYYLKSSVELNELLEIYEHSIMYKKIKQYNNYLN